MVIAVLVNYADIALAKLTNPRHIIAANLVNVGTGLNRLGHRIHPQTSANGTGLVGVFGII